MEEVWMPIFGYEGLYEISNLGRLKSFCCNKASEIIRAPRLRGGKNQTDYWTYELTKDKKQKQHSVHRLLAQAFIPNPENKPQVNHIDGNKYNNSLDNLEWATVSENTKHAYDTGLFVNPRRKLIIDLQTGIFYDHMREAALAKNVNPHTLKKYLLGYDKNKTSFVYA